MLNALLISLATGGRVSEVHSLLRTKDSMSFEDSGVTLFPNPNFLAKNENPGSRRGPIFISCLFQEDNSPHPLCPVENLRNFLKLSSSATSVKLFVKPSDGTDLPLNRLRWYLCKLIRLADPGSFPKVHDLRKVASSFAFFNFMDMQDICSLTGWSSFRVFRRHYLREIDAVRSSFVALGSVFKGKV